MADLDQNALVKLEVADLKEQSSSLGLTQVKTEVAHEEHTVEPIVKIENTGGMDNKPIKRESEGGDTQKKKRKLLNLENKNALQQLNELKPGLNYVVESISGPPHLPQFVVSVEVDGIKYVGRGNSKHVAKHAAAQAALPAEVMKVKTNYVGSSDFTINDVENGKKGAGNENEISSGDPTLKKTLKVLTEADKKNPVMLLNEIHPGLTYTPVDGNSEIPSQRFCVTVEVNGECYEGTGPNKKQAKVSAARAVLSNMYSVSYNKFASPLLKVDPIDAELFNFPQVIADKIAKLLSSTFDEVMTNKDDAKWKVISGIAMTRDETMQDIQLISFGTGTKCVNGEHISMLGANLNDCHAEIISRRCLKDFLYTNLELHLGGESDQSIFIKREHGGYCLKPHIKFHLYISTAPCGDARIFCPHDEGMLEAIDSHPNRNSRGVLRTKIESGEGTIPIKSGQGVQTWDGILPGQERLLTMSCSDKIAAWNVLGLQGALLSYFVEPIYLDSVILGGLFHPNHLRRALFGRIEEVVKDLPPNYTLNKPKMCAITNPEQRHLVKSPNFSVNWTCGNKQAEVVNSTTGKTDHGQVSRLSKRSFFLRFMNIQNRLSHVKSFEIPRLALYSSFKNAVKDYQGAKKALTLAFLEAGLGQWVKKPPEQNDFDLVF